jgi:hypothetical protein
MLYFANGQEATINGKAIEGKAGDTVKAYGTCNRCNGSGHYSYCQMYGTTCFGCGGRGETVQKRKLYTKEQIEKKEARAEAKRAAKIAEAEAKRVAFWDEIKFDAELTAAYKWADEFNYDERAPRSLHIVSDILGRHRRWGKVSTAQRNLVVKLHAQELEKLEKAPVEAGKRTIEGKVLGIKEVETDFGVTDKMRVECANGDVVYGTVPKKILEVVEVGSVVRFVATVTPSNDNGFGFFSRPSKAEVVN